MAVQPASSALEGIPAVNHELYIRGIELQRDKVESFGEYPFALPAFRNLRALNFNAPLVFLVGENGTGKSTLLEAIAVSAGFNAEGGTKNFNFETRSTHSVLHESVRLIRGARRAADGFFLRAESFYNVASEIDRLDVTHAYGGKSLHNQSHGEAFLSLVMHRFSDKGLYLLDEPEAALSPSRQLALLVRIHDLVASGSQFIIATHSPILMGSPDAEILMLTEAGIAPTAYEDTDHYLVTRRFLDDRDGMLRQLLG